MKSTKIAFNPRFKKSLRLYEQAQGVFPYGVQLFSRRPELGPLGQAPVYFERAKNAHFRDVDGNEFIDATMAFGPVILGYCYEAVDNAVKQQIDKGFLGSVNNALEIEMAQVLVDMVPCAEMVKFCKSGGEADAIAVRIARGYTRKDVVLFCGYHGWHDWYLAANLQSQSNLNTHLMPGISCKGVPSALAGTTIPFEFNNPDSLSRTLKQYEGKVACIIMEATRFKNPDKDFLEAVRDLADKYKCVLIFDEVVTGFRIAPGGAQQYYGVTPDMATFAKGIANGYPLAATLGRKEIMASAADNFISSTYWSDCVSLAAGMATLKEIREKPVIETIDSMGRGLIGDMEQLAKKYKLKLKIDGHGYDFAVSFDYGGLSNKLLTLYQQELAARGVYMAGVFYMCFTHTEDDIDKILAATDEAFDIIARGVENNDIDSLLKCPPRQCGFKRLV